MKTKIIALLFFTAPVFNSCSQNMQKPASRVAIFSYGGYGDDSVATLDGKVFYLDSNVKTKDSLTLLAGVSITVLEQTKNTVTDSAGAFELKLSKGIFSLLVTKEGFQPLLIKNYASNPDQFSGTKIYLEKGNQQQTFVIPEKGTE
jgi:hypothetical protein